MALNAIRFSEIVRLTSKVALPVGAEIVAVVWPAPHTQLFLAKMKTLIATPWSMGTFGSERTSGCMVEPEGIEPVACRVSPPLKVAITLAYVGSVIAESNASRYGIGNLITRASADFNVPLVFAALIALAILGVIIYAATVELERRMTGWAHRSGMSQG